MYNNAPMTTIKGVILGEYCYNSTRTYLDSIPDVDFLISQPDIEIVYNEQKLTDVSFALSSDIEDKYDFVSIALRDILIGMGLSNSYRYNPITQNLDNPTQEMTPFEKIIDEALGTNESPATRLANATKGELELKLSNKKSLALFAPNPWVNGISLNSFIPQSDCAISNILSSTFGKGTIYRSVNDDYSNLIFRDLLGWRYNYVVGNTTPSTTFTGSSDIKVPYKGSYVLSQDKSYISAEKASETGKVNSQCKVPVSTDVIEYVNAFHPFQPLNPAIHTEGISISILKKDGTWDLVNFQLYYSGQIELNMNDWVFNMADDDYARTPEGYLKARVTTAKQDSSGRYVYRSTYFVVDYLPQTIKLNYAVTQSSQVLARSTQLETQSIRIYFQNLEGAEQVVLERLREGARLPTKIHVDDFKLGYYDTTIDRTTTFTAVSYNANGSKRSVPLKIEYVSASVLDIEFIEGDEEIILRYDQSLETDLEYIILPVTQRQNISSCWMSTDGSIDISHLQPGAYVLNIADNISGQTFDYKFVK